MWTAIFKIKLKKEPIHVLGVYRPLGANLDSAINILSDELEKITCPDKKIVIMGDVNVDNLKENNENTKLQEHLFRSTSKGYICPPTSITSEPATSIDCSAQT